MKSNKETNLSEAYFEQLRQEVLSDVYASHELDRTLPENTFPLHEHSAKATAQSIQDELMLDGNARQNLATFCQTWAEPEMHALMDTCLTKNLVDKDEYPQTAEIEQRCINMLADLWNAPQTNGVSDTIGTATIGSSEAAMLGAMALLRNWKARQKAAGKPYDKPNLVTGPVQICWVKFCRYWEVEHREIPMEEGRLIMSPEEVIKRCDENTIGVIPTFGVTYTGQYEPVKEVSDALDTFQEQTGLDIPIHVDGASGSFLAPFIEPEIEWDFRLNRVKSINGSGHKFGLAALGIGWVLWRTKADLPEDLIFYVNYLGGNLPTININYSRPGAQVVAQYYNFLRLGREGYARIHKACYETAIYLGEELDKVGIFDVIYNGKGGIPAVCWTLKKDAKVAFDLFDLSKQLRIRGWQVPAYTMAPNQTSLVVMRALVRRGVSRDLVSALMKDLKRDIEELQANPPAKDAPKYISHSHTDRGESVKK